MIISNQHVCHICGSKNLTSYDSFSLLGRATSDCKPWTKGGRLAICADCCLVQKIIDAEWRSQVNEIYAQYDLFHQSIGNKEQPVFNSTTGYSTPRSEAIIDYVQGQISLNDNMTVIDIGCGVGNTLKSIGKKFTNAKLHGFEPNAHKKEELKKIPNVNEIYTEMLEFSDRKFDLVTMVHVLEHIDNPNSFIQNLRSMLNTNGYLVIAVPDYINNPFDLIIADHATHFAVDTLSFLLNNNGLEIVSISNSTINKEIIAICKVPSDLTAVKPQQPTYDPLFVQKQLDWMHAIVCQAKETATKHQPFGIFGTSIAANWLYGEMLQNIDFFVDEDADRTGRSYHGKPVYHSSDIPAGSHTIVCLQPNVVNKVISRIKSDAYNLYATPAF